MKSKRSRLPAHGWKIIMTRERDGDDEATTMDVRTRDQSRGLETRDQRPENERETPWKRKTKETSIRPSMQMRPKAAISAGGCGDGGVGEEPQRYKHYSTLYSRHQHNIYPPHIPTLRSVACEWNASMEGSDNATRRQLPTTRRANAAGQSETT